MRRRLKIRRLFPPVASLAALLRDKGRYRVCVLRVGGELNLSRHYFWGKGHGGACPVDEALGLTQDRVSPGAREVICRMGIVEDFAGAAEDARRIGNIPVSKERLRQIVEAEGQRVSHVRDRGVLKAAWTQSDATVDGTNKTRVYGGIDGVMAPMVTQAEKDKRRKDHVIRRQKRVEAGLGNTRALPAGKPGHEEKYREMKLGVFDDQDKEHRHCFATAKRHLGFAKLLRNHAKQVAFAQAHESITLTDGAKWIMSVICLVLSFVKSTLLDFYHLSQHVHAAAKTCFGETPQAQEWALARLEEIKTQGVKPVLLAIDALNKQVRSRGKKKQLKLLRNYLLKRLEMLDYKSALARQWDIGSGPTEAMCKNLTLRLKRTGMKWDATHAQSLMNLTALYESGQKSTYWNMRMAA